jgi:Asp/Glu/hydantoin racemase
MSTQKHTDGPWKFRFESIDPEWAIVTTASGSIIANVNSDQRQKANARLIAAAPDLLAALKNAVAFPISGNWYEEAAAAIAKAEAEQ